MSPTQPKIPHYITVCCLKRVEKTRVRQRSSTSLCTTRLLSYLICSDERRTIEGGRWTCQRRRLTCQWVQFCGFFRRHIRCLVAAPQPLFLADTFFLGVGQAATLWSITPPPAALRSRNSVRHSRHSQWLSSRTHFVANSHGSLQCTSMLTCTHLAVRVDVYRVRQCVRSRRL